MLDHAIGPNVIKSLTKGMAETMDRHGWNTLEDFRGARRDRVVVHSKIRRPDADAYHGGYDDAEGYAATATRRIRRRDNDAMSAHIKTSSIDACMHIKLD